MTTAFARTRQFWLVMGRAIGVGALSGLAAVVVLLVEEALVEMLWGDDLPTDPFTLGWPVLVIVVVGAVLVGLQRRWSGLRPPDPNFVDELMEGHADPRTALQLVLIGLTSLVGGASLGPEAPVATAGAGVGSFLGRHAHDEVKTDLTVSGLSGALGAIMTFPFAGPLLALEAQEDREVGRYERLVPALVAATVALAVVYPVIGAPFVGLITVDPPTADLASLLWAVPLGLVGAFIGVLAVVAMGLAGALFGRLAHPVVRSVTGGLVVLAVAAVLPLTLFSGKEQLPVVLEDPAALGVGLLLATLVGKLVVFGVSMRSGYFGGPVFPLLFLGGVSGTVVNLLIPSVPSSLAIAGVAGGATVAILGMPFTVVVFMVIVFALGPVGSIPVTVAIVAAYVAVHGTDALGWLARRMAPSGDASSPVPTTPPGGRDTV